MFFFQAEDGIRDSSTSRGLGDVYKRQMVPSMSVSLDAKSTLTVAPSSTLPESSTATGASFTSLIVMSTSATLLVAPSSSLMVYWKRSEVVSEPSWV